MTAVVGERAAVQPVGRTWSVGNEPNDNFWAGNGPMYRNTSASPDPKWLIVYNRTVHLIRAADPHANVVGPSINHFDLNWLTEFVTFAAKNKVMPDMLDWHSFGANGSETPSHHAAMRKWLHSNHPTFASIPIGHGEMVPSFARLWAGGTLGALAGAERAGAAFGMHSNWGENSPGWEPLGHFKSCGFEELVTCNDQPPCVGVQPVDPKTKACPLPWRHDSEMQPRATYQVYAAYGNTSGVMIPVGRHCDDADALASFDTDRGAWLVVGRYCGAGVPLAPCDSVSGVASPNRTVHVQLTGLPASLVSAKTVKVELHVIPNMLQRAVPHPLPVGTVVKSVSGSAHAGYDLDLQLVISNHDVMTVRIPNAAAAAAATPSLKTDNAEPIKPHWPATWSLSASTMTFPDGNHSDYDSAARVAVEVKYGMITYGWQLRFFLTAQRGPGCEHAKAEAAMHTQALRLKAKNPSILVFHYRNSMTVLSSFADQCRGMYNNSFADWYLKAGDKSNGRALNQPADPRSIMPCLPSVLPPGCRLPWQCSKQVQQDEFYRDYTNASAADHFITDVIGRCNSMSSCDGVWFDDVSGCYDQGRKDVCHRATILKGYAPARVKAISAAMNTTILRAQRLLQTKGKWSFNTPGGFKVMPTPTNVSTQCVAALEAAAAMAGVPTTMYVKYFAPPKPPAPTTSFDFRQRLAAFLLVRGAYSFFGHGWITDKPVVWFPEYDWNVGVPLENMTRSGNKFSRRWSNGDVSLDCDSFTAAFTFKMKSDDAVTLQQAEALPPPPPPPALMPWPATYNLSRSTMVFVDGNHSGRTTPPARRQRPATGWSRSAGRRRCASPLGRRARRARARMPAPKPRSMPRPRG